MRLAVRLAIVTATAMAVLVMIARSRQAVEVWHMAADPPSGGE